jgi:hypothetical protein
VVTTLRAEDGRVAYESTHTRSPGVRIGPTSEYGYSARVPLRNVVPGWYVLRVEARPRGVTDPPVVRQTRLHLVPSPGEEEP